ncbi:hypothetical protein HDE_07581 [Halotydeus destructor]|nr:hypothetical protein HDE_07581 [Halotydeus destructor]
MITKTIILLALGVIYPASMYEIDIVRNKASDDLKAKDDFTSLTEADKAQLASAVDTHIPFEVTDDEVFEGDPLRCWLDQRHFDNGPYNRKKYYDFTVAQKDCHKQHKAKMKKADYGDYSYCIVDNFNRMAESRDHMSLTPDNKTIISNMNFGIVKLARLILNVDNYPACLRFCKQKFNKYKQMSSTSQWNSFVAGPAINVLRQFRSCLALSRLGDKYKWRAPK